MKTQYIDVDGHILEPHGCWVDYIEPPYRDRALKILEDENGLEYLSVDGKPSTFARGGTLGAMGAIGQDVAPYLEPGRIKWEDALPAGSYDPHERIKVMDEEGIDKTLVYPTLGLVWETECDDPKLAAANCRAYNNWMIDFCQPYPDRLIPVAHIPTLDVDEGLKEFQRTSKLGAKAACVYAISPGKRPLGSHYFDPIWREAEANGIPVTIHPCTGPNAVLNNLYPDPDSVTMWWTWTFIYAPEDTRMQLTTFFNEGTFERFPDLKVVVLESGTGWLVSWLDRLDDKFEINGFTTPMKMKPSEYFQRNCWIAMDPDDKYARFNVEHLGAEKLMWAYDYPHSDAVTEPISNLEATLEPLQPAQRDAILGGNAIALYGL